MKRRPEAQSSGAEAEIALSIVLVAFLSILVMRWGPVFAQWCVQLFVSDEAPLEFSPSRAKGKPRKAKPRPSPHKLSKDEGGVAPVEAGATNGVGAQRAVAVANGFESGSRSESWNSIHDVDSVVTAEAIQETLPWTVQEGKRSKVPPTLPPSPLPPPTPLPPAPAGSQARRSKRGRGG